MIYRSSLDDELDNWPHYGAYLCIIATNVFHPHYLDKAKEICPDIKELPAITAVMEKMRSNIDEFMGLENGFGIEEWKFKDRKLMKPVCEMIRKYAEFYNELLTIFL